MNVDVSQALLNGRRVAKREGSAKPCLNLVRANTAYLIRAGPLRTSNAVLAPSAGVAQLTFR